MASKYSLILFTRETRINPRRISITDVRIILIARYGMLKSIPPKIFNRITNIAADIVDRIVSDVVFDKIYVSELSTLEKDIGAKSIVKKHLDRLIQIDAPEAAIDLDTEERYEQYYHIHGVEL